ncbi:MAG: sensor histidine kinase, partial [Pelagerythrobacter marensis]
MRWLSDSIRARLLAAAALWLTLALLGAWWVIGGVLTGFVTDRFDAEAAAIAETVIAGTEVDAAGRVTLARPPTDPRLEMPLSLWAWQLQGPDGAVIARAGSLLDLYLQPPQGFFSGGAGLGPEGEGLRVMRRAFTLPGLDGPLSVTVTAPQDEIDAALARVLRPLALALAVLGLGLAAASVAQVTLGLRALDAMGREIRAIRAGRAEALPLPPVKELRPIALEINALLDANRSVIGRARDHLGNLAHSLRTPMAALANSVAPDHPGQALIARMDRQIGWHLRRARSAGVPRLLGQATPVAAVIEDILLVLRRPAEARGLR